MSKAGSRPSAPISSPALVSAQTAVYLLNTKITALEEKLEAHMKHIETKFGLQDSFVTDNIPDLDLINRALSELNSRVLDIEGFEPRIAALETAAGTAPKPSKKRGTVKLEIPEPGISFT